MPNKTKVSTVSIMKKLYGMLITLTKAWIHSISGNKGTKSSVRTVIGFSKIWPTITVLHLQTSRVIICGQDAQMEEHQKANQQCVLSVSAVSTSPQYGFVTYKFHSDSINGEIYQRFIEDLAKKLDASKKHLIIMENASIHKSVTAPQHLSIKFLSPYSPMLNPIEEAFSAWKASVKNKLATAEVTSRI